MNKELQRIAIAEAHGRPWLREALRVSSWLHPDGTITKGWHTYLRIPDYLNDLNAMHDAVIDMSFYLNKEWCPLKYTDNLLVVVNMTAVFRVKRGAFKHTNATAAQRAEAFLKTLNLWTD